MAYYYCCECGEWQSSRDARMEYHNGSLIEHRWCGYDRTYRARDQRTYGCSGFAYVGRAVITKVCEILNINGKNLFNAFDMVKENYLVPTEMGKLVDYNTVASGIVLGLDKHEKKETIAINMLNNFIIPAEAYCKVGKYDAAVAIYERMVKILAVIFNATKEKIAENNLYDNLVKIR